MLNLVDKPGRRKKQTYPWGKVAAVAVAVVVIVAAGYYVYETYVYTPPPVFAKIGTSQGSFYVELFPSCAPKTVSNFVSLADSGFYSGLVWHRIVPGFVVQTGDPNTRGGSNSTRSTWGSGGSNSTVPLEICGWLHNYAGYIGMARQGNQTYGLDTGTSQFYVLLDNQTSATFSELDGYYTIFGKVISGMSTVCDLANNRTVPVYPSTASPSYLASQPIVPAEAMLNNVTIIPASQAPSPQTISGC